MQVDQYRAFTATLTEILARDPRVVGLIALGSMAEQDYVPDQWSDHDFFVIALPSERSRALAATSSTWACSWSTCWLGSGATTAANG